MVRPNSLAIALLAGLLARGATAGDWPQFRGPSGDGRAAASDLPTVWGGFHAPTWQAVVPGRGWSSPVVVGDRIWLTSAETTALPDKRREQKLQGKTHRDYRDQFQVHAEVTCLAVELAAATGEVLRSIELFTCHDPPPIHNTNSYASPTPASDGQRLVCHFGSLGTACLELASGRVLWQHRFLFDEITGPGSSPALAGNVVLLPCDGADQQFVLGLDIQSGETLWKTPRPKIDDPDGVHRRSFSTPLVIEHAGQQQAIIPGAQWVVAYEPRLGSELWRVNLGDCHALVPRPVFQGGLVYICTGFPQPQLWAIDVAGRGDVGQTHVVWKYDKQVPEISSPVIAGSEIYFVSSLGVATCLAANSGELRWQHRLGGNFAASPLAADGKLYFTSREGLTTVIRPGSEYHELAQNQIFGQTLASLALCGKAILLRADRTLYCIGDPSPK